MTPTGAIIVGLSAKSTAALGLHSSASKKGSGAKSVAVAAASKELAKGSLSETEQQKVRHHTKSIRYPSQWMRWVDAFIISEGQQGTRRWCIWTCESKPHRSLVTSQGQPRRGPGPAEHSGRRAKRGWHTQIRGTPGRASPSAPPVESSGSGGSGRWRRALGLGRGRTKGQVRR